MKVIINNKLISLEQTNMFGAEGEIYLMKDKGGKKCVKIYDVHKRTPYQEKKVLSLIQKFNQYDFGGVEKQIALPELPVYDPKTRKFCGFVMEYFNGYEQISKFSYDLETNSYQDSENTEAFFLDIIDHIYTYLEVLHAGGIILGDLNPQNILISKGKKPIIVDIDSAQIGTFYSNSQRNEYRDPKVQMDGFGNSNFFVYSTDSDIFSLSIIFYELMIGSNPYFYQTNPPTESYYKKEKNISLLDYVLIGSDKNFTKTLGIIKNEYYYYTLNRIIYLSEVYPKIIDYFMDVFMNNTRNYFRIDQQKSIPKITFKKYKHIEGIDAVMGFSKEDPKELNHFNKQFKIYI